LHILTRNSRLHFLCESISLNKRKKAFIHKLCQCYKLQVFNLSHVQGMECKINDSLPWTLVKLLWGRVSLFQSQWRLGPNERLHFNFKRQHNPSMYHLHLVIYSAHNIYFMDLCNFIKKQQKTSKLFLFYILSFPCFLNELPSCTNKICICLW